jgi:hypothetical protein
MELKLFRKQLKNVNLCYSASRYLLHSSGIVIVPSLNARAEEIIDTLADDFTVSSLTSVAMLQIRLSLKSHYSLKSVKHHNISGLMVEMQDG